MRMPLILVLCLLLLPLVDQAGELIQGRNSLDKTFHNAVSLQFQGEYEQTYRTIAEALEISRRGRLAYKEGMCLLRLGILSWDIGNIQDSYGFFSAAEAVFTKVGDRLSHEFCLQCLKIIQFYNGGKSDRDAHLDYSSLKRFDQAIILGRELGFPIFEMKCLRQKGLTYWQLGALNLFMECNQQGLKIADRINQKIEKGRFLNNIGVYYQKQSEYSLALAHFENALVYINSVDDQATRTECLSNIGVLYRDIGNYDRALIYLSEALKLDRAVSDYSSISIDLNNIGSTYLRRGLDSQNKQDLQQALELFLSCLSLQDIEKTNPVISFSALNNIGIIKSELSEYINAREYFAKALGLAKKGNFIIEECYVLNNIAALHYYETRKDLAIEYYKRALEVATSNAVENTIMESCLGIGQCYEAEQKPSEALLFYKRSIDAMEHIRSRISSEYFRIGFTRNKIDAYQRVVKILSDSYFNKPSMSVLEEIFQYIERGKARVFFEGISEAYAKRPQMEPSLKEKREIISLKIRELTLKLASSNLVKNEIEKLNLNLEEEEEKYLRLVSDMSTDTYPYGISLKQEAPYILQVRRQLIDDYTALLEYFLCDDQSYLIYISRKEAKLYKLAKKRDINNSLRAYIKILASSWCNSTTSFAAAKRIGKEILPLVGEIELEELRAIIIVPDGILHYLPFETLALNNEEHFTYLVENTAISYCPSVSSLFVLKRLNETRTFQKELLALGGPTYEYEGLQNKSEVRSISMALRQQYFDEGFKYSALPYSELEVTEIGKLFPKNKRNILIGKAASEGAIKNLPLDSYRLIHFACHGFQDEKHPFRSSLVLSLGSQQVDDGFLQMREIYSLSINADLVVLSACQSANGVLERTEGPIGLTRPFFYAGARSVISSLWPINDKATVYFMKEFYRFLVQGHSTTKALQLTKNRMIHSAWSRPFYWASFILSGDPIAVSIGK